MGKGKLKVIMCSIWGTGSASGHLRAQQPPLGRVPPPPVWECPPGHTYNGEGRCPRSGAGNQEKGRVCRKCPLALPGAIPHVVYKCAYLCLCRAA